MKKLLISIGIVSITFMVYDVFAQMSPTRPETSNQQDRYGQLYNPADKLEKIKGTIIDVSQTIDFIEDVRECVHLTIKIDDLNMNIPVHIGPAWYSEHQEIRFKKGDKVEITGSKITYDNQAIILASEIKRSDRTFVLRDEKGRPAWAGCSAEVISKYSIGDTNEKNKAAPVAISVQDKPK